MNIGNFTITFEGTSTDLESNKEYYIFIVTRFDDKAKPLDSKVFYKDGWLAKWDEYDLYNRFRSKLMKEIQRRTDVENAKSNEILDRYSEFAKVGQ